MGMAVEPGRVLAEIVDVLVPIHVPEPAAGAALEHQRVGIEEEDAAGVAAWQRLAGLVKEVLARAIASGVALLCFGESGRARSVDAVVTHNCSPSVAADAADRMMTSAAF